MQNFKIHPEPQDPRAALFQLLVNEAAQDAGVEPKKISAHLKKIESAGEYNVYEEKVALDIDYFEWAHADLLFRTMRHEIEHMIFNEVAGSRNNLEAVLAELPAQKTDKLYQKLYESIEKSPVYGSLQKILVRSMISLAPPPVEQLNSAEETEIDLDNPQHELIVRLIDESIAYWRGVKFATQQLENMIKSEKYSKIFEVQIRKQNFIKAIMANSDGRRFVEAIDKEISPKELRAILKKRLALQQQELKIFKAEINRIFSIIDSFSDKEMHNLKATIKWIYEQHGFSKKPE